MSDLKYLENCSYEIIEGENPKKAVYFFQAERIPFKEIAGVRFIVIYPYNWNKSMTPWKCTGKGMEETGGGDDFIKDMKKLVKNTKEGCEELYIGGYSLGGLMALYIAYKIDVFCGVASVSGSFWYLNAKDYFLDNEINEKINKIYISLGDKENLTKNAERAKVLDNTEIIVEHLKASHEVEFEMNRGGHFSNVDDRILKAVKYLCE